MNIDTQYMEDAEMMSTIPAGYELPVQIVDEGTEMMGNLLLYVVALIAIVGAASLAALV